MPGRRVLSVRFESAFAKRTDRMADRGKPFQSPDITKADPLQIRKIDLARVQDVAQSIGAGIAPGSSVGHFTDASTIKHEQTDPIKS